MKTLLPPLCLLLAACSPFHDFATQPTTRADVLLALGEPVLVFGNGSELVYGAGASGSSHNSIRPAESYYSMQPDGRRVLAREHYLVWRLPKAEVYVFDAHGILVRQP